MEEEKQGKHWYVIHTYSGYENKVRANLERKVHSLGMENEIFRIEIPTEKEVEITSDGKKKIACLGDFILDWSDLLFSVWANVDGIQKQWAMDSGISKNTKF